MSGEGRARDSGGASPHLSSGAGLRPPDTPGRWAPPGLSAAPALRRPPAIRNSRPAPAPPGAGPGNPPPAPGSSPRARGKGRRRIGLKKLRTFTKGSQLGHDLAVFFGYDTDVPKGNGRNHKYLLLFSLSKVNGLPVQARRSVCFFFFPSPSSDMFPLGPEANQKRRRREIRRRFSHALMPKNCRAFCVVCSSSSSGLTPRSWAILSRI